MMLHTYPRQVWYPTLSVVARGSVLYFIYYGGTSSFSVIVNGPKGK